MGEVLKHKVPNYATNYRNYIAKQSTGSLRIGLQTLNESIESYCYSVLGAQAQTRVSIVNQGAANLKTQVVFRQLVDDSVINNRITTWISNMRKAVSDCNTTLNLAISPSIWLLGCDMIILKHRIPGYNNVLLRASEKV